MKINNLFKPNAVIQRKLYKNTLVSIFFIIFITAVLLVLFNRSINYYKHSYQFYKEQLILNEIKFLILSDKVEFQKILLAKYNFPYLLESDQKFKEYSLKLEELAISNPEIKSHLYNENEIMIIKEARRKRLNLILLWQDNKIEQLNLNTRSLLENELEKTILIIDGWLKLNSKRIEQNRENAIRLEYLFFYLLLILIISLIILHLKSSFSLIEKIKKPVEQIHKGIERIRAGDLKYQINLKNMNEFTPLVNEFNVMSAELNNSYANLEIAKEYIENIIRSMQTLLLVTDNKGKISRVNHILCETLNYQQEELLENNISLIIPPNLYEELFPIENNQLFERDSGKTYFKANDNTRVPIFYSSSVIINKDGIKQGYLIIGKDITLEEEAKHNLEQSNNRLEELVKKRTSKLLLINQQLKAEASMRFRTEQELKKSLQEQKALMLAVPASIFFKDSNFRYISANQEFEKLVNLNVGDIIGKTDDEVFKGNFAISCKESDLKVIKEGAAQYNMLENFDYSPGANRYFLTSKVPLFSEDGKITGLAGVLVDITEQQKIYSELKRAMLMAEEANRVKSQFLANMSHETRTPLNAIIGVNGLLQESDLDYEQYEYTKIIADSANSLLSIISDVLEYARIKSGQLKVSNVDFELRKLVDKTTEPFLNYALDKGLKFYIYISNDIPERLNGDEEKIQQIIKNLLDNALKFTAKGIIKLEIILLEKTELNAAIQLNVVDTGIGITAEQKDELFNSFSQVDGSSTRKYNGTGLGLSIVKDFVEIMGGVISVESQPGTKTDFQIILPLKRQKADLLNIKERFSSLHQKKILIIENDSEQAKLINKMLKYFSLDLKFLKAGENKVELKSNYDLVIVGTVSNTERGSLLNELACKNIRAISLSEGDPRENEQLLFLPEPLIQFDLYQALEKIFNAKIKLPNPEFEKEKVLY